MLIAAAIQRKKRHFRNEHFILTFRSASNSSVLKQMIIVNQPKTNCCLSKWLFVLVAVAIQLKKDTFEMSTSYWHFRSASNSNALKQMITVNRPRKNYRLSKWLFVLIAVAIQFKKRHFRKWVLHTDISLSQQQQRAKAQTYTNNNSPGCNRCSSERQHTCKH